MVEIRQHEQYLTALGLQSVFEEQPAVIHDQVAELVDNIDLDAVDYRYTRCAPKASLTALLFRKLSGSAQVAERMEQTIPLSL